MVSSGVQVTLDVTGTNGIRKESRLQMESEIRVSFKTLDHDVHREDDIARIVPNTRGNTEITGRGFTAEHITD